MERYTRAELQIDKSAFDELRVGDYISFKNKQYRVDYREFNYDEKVRIAYVTELQ
ncbi:MAG: hypothetical protein GY861_05350 [bacterium]|nr:hypothetical protein [bacterium]